jgi:DNA end-binding protein Ku
MATRAFWKGYLKLSLVTCAVTMTPATSDSEKLRFHTLSRKTGHRVVSHYLDAVTGKVVKEADEGRGFARSEDAYVLLEDDELEAVALESTRTIDIEMFVTRDSIGWLWLDKAHYLLPGDKVGEEAFAVIREAMAATKTVGIARLVLARRERAVMLEPRDSGIVVWSLRYGDEVRDESDYFDDIPQDKPSAKLMTLVRSLIKARTKPWDAKMLKDPVQDRLLAIVAAKKKGRKRPAHAKAPAPPSDNVVSIIEALKKSLASAKR